MKKILIMGASSGIGYGVAEAFASRGVKVGLAARRTDPLKALKDKYPECVEYESIDITRKDAPERMSALIEKMGGMDIYFHVSGIGKENPVLDPELEAEVVEVNTVGFARMVSAAYDYFRDHGRKGRIAAVTSVAGARGIGPMAAYSSSKTFDSTYLVALEQLANLQEVDIKFTDIRPGWIRTPLLDDNKEYPMEMPLEEAVPRIIKAIVRHPRVDYINPKWKMLASVLQKLPTALWIKINPLTYTF